MRKSCICNKIKSSDTVVTRPAHFMHITHDDEPYDFIQQSPIMRRQHENRIIKNQYIIATANELFLTSMLVNHIKHLWKHKLVAI